MPSRQTKAELRSSPLLHSTLPVVCLVTADDEFLNTLVPELIPWFQVVVRDDYVDLARWTREENVVAVLLDIDTEGEDPHGGLKVLRELRELNERSALLSLSRSRTRLEKEALAAGADAHFRSPVDLSHAIPEKASQLKLNV